MWTLVEHSIASMQIHTVYHKESHDLFQDHAKFQNFLLICRVNATHTILVNGVTMSRMLSADVFDCGQYSRVLSQSLLQLVLHTVYQIQSYNSSKQYTTFRNPFPDKYLTSRILPADFYVKAMKSVFFKSK